MQQRASAVYAVIDIGSNTIEGLIARCSPNNVQTIAHQTTMVRLGESVDNKGEIARDKFKMALETVRKYQKLAKNQGAEVILAFATEALREARNSQDFIEAVKRETGIEVQLIRGYAEAVLDFYGATYSNTTNSIVGVLDVGGGSTELVTANNRDITWLTSIPTKEISKRYEQRLERARILPAGGLIIQTFMQHLHLNEVGVSSHGVREGALLAYTRYGQHWLEEVNSIASKRGASLVDENTKHMQEAQQQPFAEFGREVLPKYAKKFLKWPVKSRRECNGSLIDYMPTTNKKSKYWMQNFENWMKMLSTSR